MSKKQKKTPEQRKEIRKKGWEQYKKGVKQGFEAMPGAIIGAGQALGGKVVEGGKNIISAVPKGVASQWNQMIGLGKMIFNDLSWYTQYPEATKSMIGPNFNRKIGIEDPDLIVGSGADVYGMGSSAKLLVDLMLGDDANMTVTAAHKRLYAAIRQANAGASNFGTALLMEYIFNIRQFIALYSIGCRALRELNRKGIQDKGVPYAHFAAMGLDYTTFSESAADLRNLLVQVKVRMRSLAIMKMPILYRTEWLFSHAYWDSDDAKHQFYYIVPRQLGSLNGNVYTVRHSDGSLSGSATGVTASTYMTSIKNMLLDLLAGRYDILSGDILKAYGIDNCYELPAVPEVHDLPSEGYSEEVLTQIQNAWTCMSPSASALAHTFAVDTTTDRVHDSFGWVDTDLSQYLGTSSNGLMDHTYVNMYKSDITNADVLGATRLITAVSHDSANFSAVTYGTEIYSSITFYCFNYNINNPNIQKLLANKLASIPNVAYMNASGVEQSSAKISCWSQFDYAPRIVVTNSFYQSGTTTLTTAFGETLFDYNVYAKISSAEALRDIHDIATQSLYYTPLLVRNATNVITY